MKKKAAQEAKPEAKVEGAASAAPPPHRHIVGGLPKFNFNAPPTPTGEQRMTDTPLRPSYDDVQREARGPGVAEWRKADKARDDLSATYQSLRDDPRYTEEHKASQMWAAYESESERIQAAGEKARELLEREAKGHEMMAMPRPKGENIFSLSTEKLLAAQNEAARIVRTMERRQSAPGPFKPNTASVLKEEYARGIDTGGAEGTAICKGALMAADELGISAEEFLNDLRTPEQMEALDKAERCRRMAFSIPNNVPRPP
jgi:hypothetical protein